MFKLVIVIWSLYGHQPITAITPFDKNGYETIQECTLAGKIVQKQWDYIENKKIEYFCVPDKYAIYRD